MSNPISVLNYDPARLGLNLNTNWIPLNRNGVLELIRITGNIRRSVKAGTLGLQFFYTAQQHRNVQ